jgi:hypothetical protein
VIVATKTNLLLALGAVALAACSSGDPIDPVAARDMKPSQSIARSTTPAKKVFILAGTGVDKSTSSVTVGQPATFNVIAYDASGRQVPTASMETVTWTSSNSKVFPVDAAKGTGTALSVGAFLLTVKVGTASTSASYKAVAGTSTPTTNQSPTVKISSPANNASFAQGASVTFTGSATDPEDGALTGASLVWTSPSSSMTTAGATFTTSAIPVGTHTVTLTATDSKGATGSATITVTITAPSSGGSPTTPTTPTTPTPSTGWTFCTNAGAPCQFTGLRDVRLGGPNGGYVTQAAYHIVPCASYGFSNQNPAPGQTLHCDYGPMKTATMQNPQPGMAGLPATITVPLGAPGASGHQSRQVGGAGVYSDFGAFRMQCSLAKFAFDDPIVYPGQRGTSHLHMFFGNAAVDGATTSASLVATGNSTCAGGTLNRTGYWMPAVFDKTTGVVQAPLDATIYYKSGYNVDYRLIQPMPTGLKIIAGDKNNTGSQEHVWWECTDKNVGYSPTIPSCGVSVRMLVIFPQCWDGKNLDAPDHKSHMAYPVYANTRFGSKCPATHPVTLPEITEIFEFPVPGGANPAANWRLTSDMYATSLPGGRSAHADWMMGWDAPTMKTLVTQCLNKGLDCGVNFIGNGTEIYQYY